jgi:hypothetical protein
MRRLATAARLRDAFTRPRFSAATCDAARSFAGQAVEAPRDWVTGNMAAVLTGMGQLEFLPWALPATPPHGHVRVAVQRVGICGSDVHYLQRGRIGDFVVRAPLVLGHEASGEVVQLGGGVMSPRVGARVALEPGVPCWQSAQAREGRYNLDPGIVFAATPPHHGSLCSFVDHPGAPQLVMLLLRSSLTVASMQRTGAMSCRSPCRLRREPSASSSAWACTLHDGAAFRPADAWRCVEPGR